MAEQHEKPIAERFREAYEEAGLIRRLRIVPLGVVAVAAETMEVTVRREPNTGDVLLMFSVPLTALQMPPAEARRLAEEILRVAGQPPAQGKEQCGPG